MNICLSSLDRERFSALCKTMENNDRVLSLYSAYLRNCPRFIDSEMMDRIRTAAGTEDKQAFYGLFTAACGLETDISDEDRRLARNYFYPSVRELSPDIYKNDPYYKNIHFPTLSLGNWTLCRERYTPYEAFIYRDLEVRSDFCEIPQLGFFPREFSFPAVLENKNEWMTVTPNEIETMREPIAAASGKVITFGLGLGYFAYMASCKDSVESVTVIEKDQQVIKLFSETVLPQFPHKKKVNIICSDAFEFAVTRMQGFDFAFVDIWHDAGDGLNLYIRAKRLEREDRALKWSYWIETSILSQLRKLVFRQMRESINVPSANDKTERVDSFEKVCELLSDRFLKRLAKDMRKV